MWNPTAGPFYTAHGYINLPVSGHTFNKGDVLRGADAVEFQQQAAAGNIDINLATKTTVDPEA